MTLRLKHRGGFIAWWDFLGARLVDGLRGQRLAEVVAVETDLVEGERSNLGRAASWLRQDWSVISQG